MARKYFRKPKEIVKCPENDFRRVLRLISSKCSVNMNPQSALTAAEVIQHIRELADTALLQNPES